MKMRSWSAFRFRLTLYLKMILTSEGDYGKKHRKFYRVYLGRDRWITRDRYVERRTPKSQRLSPAGELVVPVPPQEADPEFSPREIRTYLMNEISLLRCLPELCSTQWSEKNFGFKHPILIEQDEGLYLRRKQMDGNYSYSPLRMPCAGKTI